ncbi:ornithine cyclodeaminase family protein [Inmirania thermothiophila]|uniref:Ornithine cyclodeaminase n=1 Tax=Inmirania thermothiophila TaxID=1750597 RepID=A0A3N1Y6T4_9GAMM|nr:ornithine cyclodeaminase family protein [Inmirania thermothiophila]ROR34228.1 ornithine cyclodeaminase [Inmirania thermothiophila]
MSGEAAAPRPAWVDAAPLAEALPYDALVEALRRAFAEGCVQPPRAHLALGPQEADGTLLLMPAWRPGAAAGTKLVTVFPRNAARGLPSVHGVYVLFDGATGAPRAILDGTELTRRRTAAASALAASFLARADAATLVVVGTGALAPHLARAHAAVRPIRRIAVWGRRAERARTLAAQLAAALPGVAVEAAPELAAAVAEADIVTCATLATEPLVRGAWLRPGAHLDLVGGFTPAMREADDEAVRRARLFVDTREGALREAGDLVQPLRAGVIAETDVRGDLFALCRGEARGRTGADEITLFKSVGCALEDLAAAELALARLGEAAT